MTRPAGGSWPCCLTERAGTAGRGTGRGCSAALQQLAICGEGGNFICKRDVRTKLGSCRAGGLSCRGQACPLLPSTHRLVPSCSSHNHTAALHAPVRAEQLTDKSRATHKTAAWRRMAARLTVMDDWEFVVVGMNDKLARKKRLCRGCFPASRVYAPIRPFMISVSPDVLHLNQNPEEQQTWRSAGGTAVDWSVSPACQPQPRPRFPHSKIDLESSVKAIT